MKGFLKTSINDYKAVEKAPLATDLVLFEYLAKLHDSQLLFWQNREGEFQQVQMVLTCIHCILLMLRYTNKKHKTFTKFFLSEEID